MKRLAVGLTLLLIVPIALLNPLGRDGFIGYYVGVLALWLALASVGAEQRRQYRG